MIEAASDKIVVLLMRRAQSEGGIFIPGNVADPQAYGKVMSVGPNIPIWQDAPEKNIKVGDIIVMHLNAGMDMVMEKNLMRTVKYDEVYGVLTDENFISNLEEMVISSSTEGESIVSTARQLIHPV